MKLSRVMEYLGTLLKLKRSFSQELADEAEDEMDRKFFEGRASAFDEAAKEIDAAHADLIVPKRMEVEAEKHDERVHTTH